MNQTFVLDPIFRQMLRKIGANVDNALAEIYIIADNKKAYNLTEKEYTRFIQHVSNSMPYDDGVLRILNIHNIESFSPPSFAAMCSHNGLEFIERFIRYKRLVCPLVFNKEDDGKNISIKISLSSGLPLPPFLEELEIAYILTLIRNATSHYVIPLKIVMSHTVKSQPLLDFFGMKLERSDYTQITLSKEDLNRPFITYNDRMWDCLKPGLEQQLFEFHNSSTFIKEVRQIICRLISGGKCTLESASGMLCMSVRTFQRKLAEQGLKFNQLVSETRHELAVIYLNNPQMTVSDISYLLGFKEYNSFLRAFRKWEGVGVAEFRRQKAPGQ